MEQLMESGTNNKYNKPNFLIVGAAKSGTTSLVEYLNQHPDIHFHPNKELRFFVKDNISKISKKDPLREGIFRQSILNEKEYFDYHNSRPEEYVGEASVHYLFHYNEAIPKIKKHLGDIPIIIILRDPVKRAISNWAFNGADTLSLNIALKEENRRKNKGFNSFWYYQELGLYYKMVKKYTDNFTNVKIIIFENFIKDINYDLNNILKFLGIQEYFDFKTDFIFNETAPILISNKLLRKLSKNPTLRYYMLILNSKISWPRTINKKELIDKKDLDKLSHFYSNDIKKLEHHLGYDLEDWKENI